VADRERVVSYAQNREDVILAAFFPDVERGFYIDLGAYHPTHDSVSKYFYDRGWYGINVEPNKKLYKQLVIERPNDTNLQIGVADKAGELTYREYEDGEGLSTFSTAMQKNYLNDKTTPTGHYKDHNISVKTLAEICAEQKVKAIHWLKVDIEGFEYEALSGNDWQQYRPEVICIEANHIVKDWRSLLKQHGYQLVFFDGLNEYYAASAERAAKFSYVDDVIGRSVVYYKDHEDHLQHVALEKRYKHMMAKHLDREQEFMREITYRDTLLVQSRRLSTSFITFLQACDRFMLHLIGRFNHPKRKNVTKGIEIRAVPVGASVKQLLQVARENDLRNFYTTNKSSSKFERQYVYSILLFLYNTPKKLAVWCLRKLYHGVKPVVKKGAVRGTA